VTAPPDGAEPGRTGGARDGVNETAVIEESARLGARIRVGGNAVVGSAVVGDDVVIDHGAVVAARPPGGAAEEPAFVGDGVQVGANAVVLAGVSVGDRAVIGPNAVVEAAIPSEAIVSGNPARIVGYVSKESGEPLVPIEADAGTVAVAGEPDTDGDGARLIECTIASDLRGSLVAVERDRPLPFTPQRAFVVYDVPGEEVRGEHAHRTCAQFLVALTGRVHGIVDDGDSRREYLLDSPGVGLYLPPMTWGTQYRYSADAVLLVLASHPYDASDYIRDYAEFLELRAAAVS